MWNLPGLTNRCRAERDQRVPPAPSIKHRTLDLCAKCVTGVAFWDELRENHGSSCSYIGVGINLVPKKIDLSVEKCLTRLAMVL